MKWDVKQELHGRPQLKQETEIDSSAKEKTNYIERDDQA
jgi:hypothetical protein